ncbi:hypothetical protein AWB79_05727 [Caballeronia hypogeia]|uniref:Uncharacterized protein n=1 Tax=Caballeronia hypogeia TaxID=1777140 RepID=A0A158CPG6_9BURK|nr:hypothetical protein [Caballeronia hypogeia]SAK84160.1 hypothetical protein AWB79_05727 [Caballeronia hypogeia]
MAGRTAFDWGIDVFRILMALYADAAGKQTRSTDTPSDTLKDVDAAASAAQAFKAKHRLSLSSGGEKQGWLPPRDFARWNARSAAAMTLARVSSSVRKRAMSMLTIASNSTPPAVRVTVCESTGNGFGQIFRAGAFVSRNLEAVA